ncbi:hypothetical protein MVEN_01548600 [Mycena venus]|uniref:Protein kinase domain-containing protein n=1 Tax=Mycena venus TaxID=2733690 RepID=A0A8H7CTQ3_9AGAR|nr:hypothetical protein MVEN_01548600 [Mycena venus]
MIAVKQVEIPRTASDKNDSRQVTVVQALKLESETLKVLDHPNIVQYLGFEETPTNLSIFLEYVPGGSIGSCLLKHGRFDEDVTKSFTLQILAGLEYLHSKGILHRDLKSDNILVEMSGVCKISDFGISKRTDDQNDAHTAMQGTVFWMAPEVINTQKKGYSFKIDIWSIGCVVLEMWAGTRPWLGDEMVTVMFKLFQSKLPPPVPDGLVLSPLADDFRKKCFAINPEERPSAAELKKHPYLTPSPGWVFDGFATKSTLLTMSDLEDTRDRAARRIQRAWRARRSKATDFLTTSVRLNDAMVHAKLTAAREAADAGHNTPQARWRRAIDFAARLQDGNTMLTKNGVQDRAPSKFLETQHWLELVDGKHRYGSNLKASRTRSRRRWQREDTTENFFRWLDKGGGKSLSLEECPREQLEKEATNHVRSVSFLRPVSKDLFRHSYLSTEQRLNYLVEIDSDGRLRWARNHELVDTTAGRWKDSENGNGIIADDVSLRQAIVRGPSLEGSESVSSRDSVALETAATHYAGPRGKYRLTREFRKRFTLRGIVDRMLRKTVKRNTWIYVSDKNFNIFVGIKVTGTFQHSSLLSGGVVTSAGLISVKQGIVHTLSPLSGHYRTSVEHFHQFIDVLNERGVDMSKAKISKAELALWGIEHIKRVQKSKRRIVESGKQNISDTLHKVGDVANISWKREVLEGRGKAPPEKESTQDSGQNAQGPQ